MSSRGGSWGGHFPAALAVLSDVHGNLGALDAVLDDVSARGIRDIVHLGDAVYGPLDPRGTAERMIERGIPSVRGNEDRLVAFPEGRNATVDFARSELRAEHVRWLAELPPTIARGDLLLCHGTPRDDATYLLLDVSPSGVRARDPSEVAALVEGIEAAVVLCGHDHTPNAVRLPGGVLVANPGSVGCPAYEDDQPAPHRIENGTPHARYAILSLRDDEWACERIAVAYDWNAAAALARRNGRPDWSLALATGRTCRARHEP